MAMNDPLGDMITRIRNAQRSGHAAVMSPASKFRVSVLEVLQRSLALFLFVRRVERAAIGVWSPELDGA